MPNLKPPSLTGTRTKQNKAQTGSKSKATTDEGETDPKIAINTAADTKDDMKQQKKMNRMVFGFYLIVMGSWILINPSHFFTFILMTNEVTSWIWMSPLLAIQTLILGYYNIVAARHYIDSLMQAGERGGFFAILAFSLLVNFGYLKPMALLIPMVDLVSIILMFVKF